MDEGNATAGFILLGLFNHTRAHLVFFVLVLTVALNSMLGNTLLLLLIHQDCRLHTPMYFLLSQLSLMDMMLIFTIVPQMAAGYLMDKKSISTAGCGFQIFFFLTLDGGECFLLAAMSYDPYVAICHQLRYPVLMSGRLCLRLILGSWLLGAADGAMQAAATLSFSFCNRDEIDHFFCEAPVLLRLACGDTSIFEFVMHICCVLMLLVPFSLILMSYGLILTAVLRMRSTEGRRKAFASCSSHLAVEGLFYGAAIFVYMRPTSSTSANHDKVVSAFYTLVTPMLNPLIYSLRNNEVNDSLRKYVACCITLTRKDALVCLDLCGCAKRKGMQ
ncbi:olfactory receptor 2T8-like [Acomys russatus]|uniref:olfactory receptor 2T8-like n=1 Tax=Acomys russatus TaxID=60746 RepID=UPI0021E26119|nr:olfactory receptor 2T8-like [Acomys russatus]